MAGPPLDHFRACSRAQDAVSARRHRGVRHVIRDHWPGRARSSWQPSSPWAPSPGLLPRSNGHFPQTQGAGTDVRRHDLEPEQPNRNLGPCLKCVGTLAYGEDRYGPYVRRMHCGKLVDLLAAPHDATAEAPDSPPSRVVRNPRRLTVASSRGKAHPASTWSRRMETPRRLFAASRPSVRRPLPPMQE